MCLCGTVPTALDAENTRARSRLPAPRLPLGATLVLVLGRKDLTLEVFGLSSPGVVLPGPSPERTHKRGRPVPLGGRDYTEFALTCQAVATCTNYKLVQPQFSEFFLLG